MVPLVIVPQEVQEAVQGQEPKLNRFAVPGVGRLAARDAPGDRDVAKRQEGAGGQGDWGTEERGAWTGWERQHVRCAIFSPVPPVQKAHARVADERDRYNAPRPRGRYAPKPRGKPAERERSASIVNDLDCQPLVGLRHSAGRCRWRISRTP